MLEIRIGEKGVIVLSGRFDASQAVQAERFMAGLAESRVLDLANLVYISSLGLGVLLETQKRLMASGHSLKLVNVRGYVREIFNYSGFERIFEIEPAPPT